MKKKTQVERYAENLELRMKAPTLFHYPVTVKCFAPGAEVVRFQEPIRELQFMLEGRAKVFNVMENGRAVLHTIFQGFEVIGDLEFLRGYPNATTDIQAVTEVILLGIPLDRCHNQLTNDAVMLRFLGEELAKKLERSSRRAAQNLLYPLSTRLAAYMLFSAQEGLFAENLVQVSEMLGTSYRHLLRTLKDFCKQGALERMQQGYRIADEALLRREKRMLLWEE